MKRKEFNEDYAELLMLWYWEGCLDIIKWINPLHYYKLFKK